MQRVIAVHTQNNLVLMNILKLQELICGSEMSDSKSVIEVIITVVKLLNSICEVPASNQERVLCTRGIFCGFRQFRQPIVTTAS
jgi:hypothetical protein